jgi:hypothetical protein
VQEAVGSYPDDLYAVELLRLLNGLDEQTVELSRKWFYSL